MSNPTSQSGDSKTIKEEIARRYPSGQFVAIQSGECIADAVSHRELVSKLSTMGLSPKDMLILQAGVEYPESAIILLDTSQSRGDA